MSCNTNRTVADMEEQENLVNAAQFGMDLKIVT